MKRYSDTMQQMNVSHKKNVGKRSPTGRNVYNMIPCTAHPKKGRHRLYHLGMHIQVIKPQGKARKHLHKLVLTSRGRRPEIREGRVGGGFGVPVLFCSLTWARAVQVFAL